jgi:hypothetical protein
MTQLANPPIFVSDVSFLPLGRDNEKKKKKSAMHQGGSGTFGAGHTHGT